MTNHASTDLSSTPARDRLAVIPGVYDVLSARLAKQAGFHAAVLTGYGVAATYLGQPDVGLLTQTEILDVARRILENVEIGLIVDGDTGHGGPLNVARMVRSLATMGARGIILEDQRWPKRCGHMAGKEVVSAEEHVAKIRAAVDARGDAMLFITARTDALETHGVDEAIRRALMYKEAGADILFVEGPRTVAELRQVGEALPAPVAVNLIEGGRTPLCSIDELTDMGFFSVGFVLSPLYAATHALRRTYGALHDTGGTDELREDMVSFSAFNGIIGARERLDWADRFATEGR